jgi:hypothetical protein
LRDEPPARQSADCGGTCSPAGGADLHRTAASGDPLGRPRDGQDDGHLAALDAAHLPGARTIQPHRIRTFKRSRDPSFAAKLTDIVDLDVDPPAHAVVLSLDEKSQIQALDRTQPGLPIKPGRWQTMTHDYKCHGGHHLVRRAQHA